MFANSVIPLIHSVVPAQGSRMVVEKMTCLLCRGLIAFKARDQTRFLDHMKEEHNVRYDFSVLLVTTLMNEAEKKTMVNNHKAKWEPQNKNNVIEAAPIKPSDTVSTHPCKFCDLRLSSNNELKNHMASEHVRSSVKDVINLSDTLKTKEAEAAPSIEGVLKCKVCSKYVKQSAMAEHKLKHASNKEEDPKFESLNEEVEPYSEPTLDSNEQDSSKTIQKRKARYNDDSDDSDDEDWVKEKVDKTRKAKRLQCAHCKKVFGSSMALTTHERMAHGGKRGKSEANSVATVVLSRDL